MATLHRGTMDLVLAARLMVRQISGHERLDVWCSWETSELAACILTREEHEKIRLVVLGSQCGEVLK